MVIITTTFGHRTHFKNQTIGNHISSAAFLNLKKIKRNNLSAVYLMANDLKMLMRAEIRGNQKKGLISIQIKSVN